MKSTERFEPTNYEEPWIRFPLEIVLIVRRKGKGKAIPVQHLEAMCFPGIWSSQIWRQSAHERGNDFSSTHQLLLPPRNIHVIHFC